MTGARRHTVGVMGGDGAGPELVAEALLVLAEVARLEGFEAELRHFPHSGAHYRSTGELLGDAAVEAIASTESLLFGAVGDPELPEGTMERGLLAALVQRLRLSIGVRPATLHADWLTPLKGCAAGSVDMVIVRDSSEDIFAGPGAQLHAGTEDEVTVAIQAYTRRSVERVVRHAYELARRRRGRLTLVAQANAIPAHALWTRTARELSAEYPSVELREAYPDAAAMLMVTRPSEFDVLVTTMWLGGTLSDLMGAVVGGIGLVGSARIDPERGFGLFEPAHGSAPRHAGHDRLSPLATFRALAMLLEQIGEAAAARRVERAIGEAIVSGRIRSVDTRGPTTMRQATAAVVDCLAAVPAETAPPG